MRKVPFVPQLNSTECGVCVLTMILRYFGAYHPMYEIRNHLHGGRDGVTIRKLIKTFQYYGINASAYHGVIDNTSPFPLPAIITWENDHYVIVERICRKHVVIVDSNIGRIKMTYEEFNKNYSGIIILLSKTEQFKKKRRHLQFKNSFSLILNSYKKDFIILIFLSLLAQLFTLFVPIAVQYLIDGLFSVNSEFHYLFLFAVVILFNSLFLYLKRHYMLNLGVNIDRAVNKRFMVKLLTVKYSFYDIKNNAEIIYALDNITCVKNIYLDNILGCLFDILSMLFILTYLFRVNIIFCTVVLIVLIPNIMLLIFMDKPIQKDIRLMIREYENIYGQEIEIVYSILGIKTSSVEHPILNKWIENYNFYYKKNKDYQIKMNMFKVTLSTMVSLSPIIVLVLAILYVQRGFITIGTAMAFYAMANMLFGSVNVILSNIRSLRDNLISLERIEDIMQYDEEILSIRTNTEININGDIEINNISFKYTEEGEYILKNISCTIDQNSKVAVIGGSGSGKSTFLKVLSGLYRLNGGTILYSNNCMDYGTEVLIKKKIGFVTQNVWPMNQSIKDYILLGLSNATMEDVEKACKIVNIHDEIMKMPMKYHTIISETGKNISGGQCQRIMLARMVLLKPKILLLDEATSALDVVNENIILDYFFKQSCTIIMVTHKLESIKNCDKVLIMKDGTLFTQGKYDELVRKYGNILNK